MFEYLMPALILKYEGTLFDETYTVVDAQKAYGEKLFLGGIGVRLLFL